MRYLVIFFLLILNLNLQAEKDPFLSPFKPKEEIKPKSKTIKRTNIEIVKSSTLTPALKESLKKTRAFLKAENTEKASKQLTLLIEKDPKTITIPDFNNLTNDLDNIAVFGPGTGLGVKHLTHTSQGWLALDGEGGHVDFAPVDEVDIAIWKFLTDKLGHASAEEVLSGRGLVHIYQAIAKYKGLLAPLDEPADITERALDGSCALSVATLSQFCKILGSFAGNLALNLGTRGGVYVGGGIAPRFTNFIKQSDFRLRFEAKGRFRDYVAGIPTFIITEPDHGLIGAMAYLNQNCKG